MSCIRIDKDPISNIGRHIEFEVRIQYSTISITSYLLLFHSLINLEFMRTQDSEGKWVHEDFRGHWLRMWSHNCEIQSGGSNMAATCRTALVIHHWIYYIEAFNSDPEIALPIRNQWAWKLPLRQDPRNIYDKLRCSLHSGFTAQDRKTTTVAQPVVDIVGMIYSIFLHKVNKIQVTTFKLTSLPGQLKLSSLNSFLVSKA